MKRDTLGDESRLTQAIVVAATAATTVVAASVGAALVSCRCDQLLSPSLPLTPSQPP